MRKDSRIFVAGIKGMVGSAINRALIRAGFTGVMGGGRAFLDLTDSSLVRAYFAKNRPEYVFLAAARVGGIVANNTFPAEFIYSNLCIQNNVIHASHEFGVKKLLFLGSSCIYPRDAAQPIREDALLSGPLEKTNEAYAIAKIAGLKMCEFYAKQYGDDFITAMPTNLYGPGDNYDLAQAHVLPALLRKVHEAKVAGADSFTVWGSGKPLREFLHVDDLAQACLFLMENYHAGDGHINVGSGDEISIRGLAEQIGQIIGFRGKILFDASKPDGTPRKLMDSSRIRGLGWSPKIGLEEGLYTTYASFLEASNLGVLRG